MVNEIHKISIIIFVNSQKIPPRTGTKDGATVVVVVVTENIRE